MKASTINAGDEHHGQRSVPPISDYAIIGDCRSAALISRSGSMDWLCLPHFSSASVFAALLDTERGGRFAVTPSGEFSATRRYRGNSAILETTFETDKGLARLTDAMVTGQSARNLEPSREIVRIVEGVRGTVSFDIIFEPRPNFSRGEQRLQVRGKDWLCVSHNDAFLLRSEQLLRPHRRGVCALIEVNAGERFCFSLTYEKGDIAILLPLGAQAVERVQRTASWWEEWSSGCCGGTSYRDVVMRSAITLKLLTFALSGAVVAAPTASLPEWIGGDRNWDYRYCWLRDAALTMRALMGLELQREASAFLRWLLHATRLTRPRLGAVYDVFGRANLVEQELGTLSGYRASRPVRIGNAAHNQIQLDVYGGVIAAAAEFVRSGGSLQRDQRKLLAAFGKTVCDIWRTPDYGIWEIRNAKRHYTFSKLMCWVALDRLLQLNEVEDFGIDVEQFERERSVIADAIETYGFNEELGSYVGAFGGQRLDASLLLMPCLDYCDPASSRMKSTFERIEARLGRDGLIYRYEPGFDGMATPEGAFGICGFWAIENLARRGEVDRAEYLFEQLLARANDVGLFAEEVDPDTGAALGNFPQAFTHVGLINAALALERARSVPQ